MRLMSIMSLSVMSVILPKHTIVANAQNVSLTNTTSKNNGVQIDEFILTGFLVILIAVIMLLFFEKWCSYFSRIQIHNRGTLTHNNNENNENNENNDESLHDYHIESANITDNDKLPTYSEIIQNTN